MEKTSRSIRTREGMAEAAARGRFPGRQPKVSDDEIRAAIPLGTAAGARSVGLSRTRFILRRKRIEAAQSVQA